MHPDQQKQPKIDARAKKLIAQKVFEYGTMGVKAGCPQEQIENFLKAGVWLQSKQLEIVSKCRECDKADGPKDVLAGGGRGAAKTHAILAQIFCDDCQRMPGLKVLVLRKVGRANKEQIQDFRKKLLSKIPHNYREQQSTITFENSSLVILGNFKDEKDIDKYLGLEYDVIHIVESNQLTNTKKMNILSCLRTNKTNWRPRCYEDTNPGGIGHFHNKQIFVEPYKAGKETETRYIHCTIDDNQFVDSGYKEYLEKLVGWQREAWLHGSWEFMAGAFFTNWTPDIHIFPNESVQFDVNKIIRWFGSMDYGFTHPNAFQLHCECEDGNFFTLRASNQSETLIQDHCENIRDILRLQNLSIDDLEYIAAGRDCFKVDKDGSTVATEYEANGIILTPVQIDRVNAWAKCQERLGDPSRGIRPTWFIHRSCEELCLQISIAQADEKRIGDVLKMNADESGQGGDDQLECFIAGTKIKTQHGETNIEDLRVCDLVWTRKGLRPVWKTIRKSQKETITVKFSDGSQLTGTPEHPVWNGANWQRLDSLRNGDTVSSWLKTQKLSYSTEENSYGIRTPNIGTFDVIFGRVETSPKDCEDARFMSQLGNWLMVWFRKATIFITKMGRPWIIRSATWSANLDSPIFPSMVKADLSNNLEHKWTMLESSHQNGIVALRGRRLVKESFKSVLRIASKIERLFASSVGLEQQFTVPTISQSFVLPDAKRHKKEKREGIWKKGCALFAGLTSKLIKAEMPKLAPLSVVDSYCGSIDTVYNLTVEDCHEYFANGVLVHNCWRNSVCSEFNAVLRNATPLQMGNYQSLNDTAESDDRIMRGEILLEQTYDSV